MDLQLLAEREWWTDFGYARWCDYRLLYECTLRLLRRQHSRVVIYPYENLPWEKMFLSAARASGVKTLGYQHALIGLCELNYYLGDGEALRAPLPDCILTAGDAQRKTLVEQGTPGPLCRTGGSLWHAYLLDARPSQAPPRKKVLVALGHHRASAELLLQALSDAFPDRGSGKGCLFICAPIPRWISAEETSRLGCRSCAASLPRNSLNSTSS